MTGVCTDPCFSCRLEDCDETDPRCGVRQLARSYNRKVRDKRHDLITPEEREANNRIFDVWKLERMAQASEGLRPYRRAGSPWTGEEAPKQ